MSSSEFECDMAAEAEQAWTEFRGRLADRIAEMADDDIVCVEVESGIEAEERTGAAPYLQLIGWGEEMVRAEVASNQYLDERYELTIADEELLGAIGWLAPTYVEGEEEPDAGSANFHVDLERREADRLAVMSVRVLREVFGCVHPVFLVVDGLPEAVADSPAAMTGSSEDEVEEPLAVFPESSEDLQHLVDQALAPGFDGPLSHDDDGDIPIVCGQSVVFVRVNDSRPAVDLYCEMVLGVQDRERAAEEVGILNGNQSSARFHLRDDIVVATYRIYAWPFAPMQLRVALAQLTENIDDLARDLATRVGGHRFAELPDEPGGAAEDSDEDEAESLTGLLEMLYDGPARPGQVAALFDNDRGSLIRQLVRLRTGQDQPGEHDLDLVLGQLRAALRFVADVEALPRPRRHVPPRPDRSRQLTLLPDGEDTLDPGLWVHDLEESS